MRHQRPHLLSLLLLLLCGAPATSSFAGSERSSQDSSVRAALFNANELLLAGQVNLAWAKIAPLVTASISPASSPATAAQINAQAGAIRLAQGRPDEAQRLLNLALANLEDLDSTTQAALHNSLGLLAIRNSDPVQAANAFRTAVASARGQVAIAVLQRYQINLAKALIARTDIAQALTIADQLRPSLTAPPTESIEIELLLGLGSVYAAAAREPAADPKLRLHAFKLWQQASMAAKTAAAPLLRSYALGLIGELYELEERPEDALVYARKAAFAAQQTQAAHALLRWEWLSARLLRTRKDPVAALAAYRRTITILKSVRADLDAAGSDAFQTTIGPIYYQYADVLMRSARTADADTKRVQLLEARDAVEALKFAEVEDYLGNQCLQSQSQPAQLQRVDPTALVIYPVVLDDRLELLVSSVDGIREYRIDVARSDLDASVRALRTSLQVANNPTAYLPQAQALYQLLIGPIEAELEQRKPSTLVFVPDGSLRTLPLSVLHDGERFLIERYAIATSPGLTLTAPKPLGDQSLAMFAGGLSEAVQGFRALPGVEAELAGLASRFDTQVFRNQDFSLQRVRDGLAAGGYQIAHFATHGKFGSSYEDSFLLAYDGRLSVDQLSASIRSRQQQSGPLELLVMSACETAAGDDRAALGLAGLAISAGARSALATLWAVEDRATARLMTDFYAGLQGAGLSKAESLRQAQIALLGDADFWHPGNWSPFLIIGNWL